MNNEEPKPVANTDVEIFREEEGNYYSPSVHKTQDGRIGMNVGGNVFVASVREWHQAMGKELSREEAA